MNKRHYRYAVLPAFFLVAAARADYPLMNIVADKVIDKYKNATCEELWEDKEKPKSDEAKNAIQILKENPQMRIDFIDKIAAPVVNKMFECGMVP